MSGARRGGAVPRPSPSEVAAWRARMPRAFAPAPARRALRWALGGAFLAWLAWALWQFGFTPQRLWNGLSGLTTILRLMVPPSPGEQWAEILRGLGESLAMAFLGTLLAAVIALPLGALGARNVLTVGLLRFSLRRVFDGMRGIDQLVWALAYVRAVGLGPLAGVLAIASADVAVLAKIYAEAIENADRRQVEGIAAVGGGRLAQLRFGLLPQVAPVILAQALYFFESNVRSAAILGVVGAGGIGLQIAERIRVRYWDEVAFIILLLILTVAAIDALSARLRRRLIGGPGAARA
ncbi:phosphonate ABC transporter, permease protein PhnE [Caldovatus sediminis]|uniref:Phosphonate ABC transporter, permease protein PhnE n=1 Tax=Caldovatus sediminis TaxID=2041189 RepID=A0A8J2ZDZ7_9PROT|nr:phosphonate ABC transporter, permease protein PhnE [Caldovatus sediminis]GGG45315.1 phosphonate ABC transporter, permease protein PhnE [Caldovatus sediminis]